MARLRLLSAAAAAAAIPTDLLHVLAVGSRERVVVVGGKWHTRPQPVFCLPFAPPQLSSLPSDDPIITRPSQMRTIVDYSKMCIEFLFTIITLLMSIESLLMFFRECLRGDSVRIINTIFVYCLMWPKNGRGSSTLKLRGDCMDGSDNLT